MLLTSETIEALFERDFVLWPERDGSDLRLVKRADVTSPGIEDDPLHYGALSFGWAGRVFALPDSPRMMTRDLPPAEDFADLDSAIHFLLDHYDRLPVK